MDLPNISYNEILKDQIITSPGVGIPVIVGNAIKGPVNTPILITNSNSLVQIFGEPIDNSSNFQMSINELLKQAQAVYAIRVKGDSIQALKELGESGTIGGNIVIFEYEGIDVNWWGVEFGNSMMSGPGCELVSSPNGIYPQTIDDLATEPPGTFSFRAYPDEPNGGSEASGWSSGSTFVSYLAISEVPSIPDGAAGLLVEVQFWDSNDEPIILMSPNNERIINFDVVLGGNLINKSLEDSEFEGESEAIYHGEEGGVIEVKVTPSHWVDSSGNFISNSLPSGMKLALIRGRTFAK